MSRTQAPKDILDSYAWMKRMVVGLETQSIKTVRGADYGIKEKLTLAIRAGWELGINGMEGHESAYSKPYARVLSDHTTIFGAIRWHEGVDERALVIPPQIAPFENYTFDCWTDTGVYVPVQVTTAGFLSAPAGIASPILLTCRYASAREGG